MFLLFLTFTLRRTQDLLKHSSGLELHSWSLSEILASSEHRVYPNTTNLPLALLSHGSTSLTHWARFCFVQYMTPASYFQLFRTELLPTMQGTDSTKQG